jgi:hypothetical protein
MSWQWAEERKPRLAVKERMDFRHIGEGRKEGGNALNVWGPKEFYIKRRHAGLEMGIGKDIIQH